MSDEAGVSGLCLSYILWSGDVLEVWRRSNLPPVYRSADGYQRLTRDQAAKMLRSLRNDDEDDV